MLERDIAYMNFLVGLVYLRRRTTVSRDQCLCALIEFVRRMRIDFSRCASVDEMTSRLTEEFRSFPHRLRNPPVSL